MPDTATKRCRECGEIKPLDGFNRDRSRRDGHQAICRPCHAIRQKRRYQAKCEANPDYRRVRHSPETRACVVCGTEFQLGGRGVHRDKKYCSIRCAAKINGAGNAAIALAAPRKPKDCPLCGLQFTPPPGFGRVKYCPACRPTDDQPGRSRIYLHGISVRAWEEMTARYDGQCWICHCRPATDLDHNHATGRVRGALCSSCNRFLARVEDPQWLASAMAYLKEFA